MALSVGVRGNRVLGMFCSISAWRYLALVDWLVKPPF